jgi:transposase/integrase
LIVPRYPTNPRIPASAACRAVREIFIAVADNHNYIDVKANPVLLRKTQSLLQHPLHAYDLTARAIPRRAAVAGISRVKSVKTQGIRVGNWLSLRQAQALLSAPDITTVRGLRDRAILAVLLGCGLRRSEVAAVTFTHLRQRDGRRCIVDLVGKHGRVRTAPMPTWVKVTIDAWASPAGVTDGHVFRSVNRADRVTGEALGEKVVWQLIKPYAEVAGVPGIAPHDLRRTCAKLCRAGGAKIGSWMRRAVGVEDLSIISRERKPREDEKLLLAAETHRTLLLILNLGGLLIMMGQHIRSESLFYYFRLEDHVPENHLLRMIDRHVSLTFVREKLQDSYSETGRPSIDPELLLRILLIGYLYGITSERKLVEELRMHLAWRWFTGLGFDQEIPHHSTFSKNRHGRFADSKLFEQLFEEIVARCIGAN